MRHYSRALRALVTCILLASSLGACSILVDTSGLAGHGTIMPSPDVVDGEIVDGPRADADAGDASSATADGVVQDRYFDAVMSDHPIAYFRLADTTTAAAAKNEVADSAIAAIYPTSDATRGAPGALSTSNGALQLHDPSAKLEVVGPLDFVGDVPFTLEAWVKIDDFAGTGIAGDMTFTSNHRTGWVLFLQQNDTTFHFRSEMWSDEVILLYAQHPSPVTPVAFHHVVLLHSDVDHIDHLLIDGVSSDEGLTNNGPGARSANAANQSWGGFNGTLDELAIYDKALPSERIAAHLIAR